VCECLQTSGAVKLYLFDVFTKLAIAADSAPDDSLQFHVCSDVIDIAVDVGTICWSVDTYSSLSLYHRHLCCRLCRSLGFRSMSLLLLQCAAFDRSPNILLMSVFIGTC